MSKKKKATKKVVLFHLTRTEYSEIPEDVPTDSAEHFELWLEEQHEGFFNKLVIPDSEIPIPEETVIEVMDPNDKVVIKPSVRLEFK